MSGPLRTPRVRMIHRDGSFFFVVGQVGRHTPPPPTSLNHDGRPVSACELSPGWECEHGWRCEYAAPRLDARNSLRPGST